MLSQKTYRSKLAQRRFNAYANEKITFSKVATIEKNTISTKTFFMSRFRLHVHVLLPSLNLKSAKHNTEVYHNNTEHDDEKTRTENRKRWRAALRIAKYSLFKA